MKRLLIILCAIFALSAGTEFYVAAQPAEGIKITSNHISSGVKQVYGVDKVYAWIKNNTNETINVSWSLTVNGSVVASGTATIAPHNTFESPEYTMTASLSYYNISWGYI